MEAVAFQPGRSEIAVGPVGDFQRQAVQVEMVGLVHWYFQFPD